MTSRILSIDTTGPFGSLALLLDGEVVDETSLHSEEGFSRILYGELERMLVRADWRLSEIDAFAAAAGPGSFTGIRVGLAAVKGLAEALQKPVFGVSNLQAVAWYGSAPLRAVLLDARRGQVYGAVYTSALQVAGPETVETLEAWLESLPEVGLEFLSTDLGPFHKALDASRFRGAARKEVPQVLAGTVGRIAARRLAGGENADPVLLEANYVRHSDAELFWLDR